MTRQVLYALLLALAVLWPRAIVVRESHSEASDDDYHLIRGLEFLRGDPGLIHHELNDPPLGEAIAALPLWIMGGTTHGTIEGTALYGQTGYSPETALMAVALWKSLLFLPLIAIVFVWTRQLYGLPAAWLATALLLVEPTIAAHLPLASLDVIATSGIVIACYCGWRCFEHPTVARIRLAAFTCAAAMLLKHTAVLLPVILCGYALIFCALRKDQVGRIGATLAKAAFLTLFAIWVLTAFDFSPAGRLGAMPGGLYVKSAFDAANHVRDPNDAYLWGEIRRGGWWYYFPAVALYKVPIGLAAIIAMGLFSFFCVRPRWEECALFLPLVAYVVFLMLQDINIGWRHFLPAYVLALIVASRCATAGRYWKVAAWSAVALTVIDTARWQSDYLSYVNWPRPDVYRDINDSNIDWGQGLKQANVWLDDYPAYIAARPVYLRASAVTNRGVRHYLGRRVIQLHFGDVPPRHGILILSPVCLSGLSESADEYAFLRGVPPRAVIGHALRVYDLDALAH